MLKVVYLILLEAIKSMAFRSKPMEISNTTSGLQEQNPLPFSVISTNGIERSLGVREMSLEHGVSRYPLRTVNLALPTTQSTRSILKDPMVTKWIEIQHGQPTRSKIQTRIYLIACSGIHLQDTNGSTQNQLK